MYASALPLCHFPGVEPYSKCPFSNRYLSNPFEIAGPNNSVDTIRIYVSFHKFSRFKSTFSEIYIQNKSVIPPHNIHVLLKIYTCWTGVFCMVLRVFSPVGDGGGHIARAGGGAGPGHGLQRRPHRGLHLLQGPRTCRGQVN